VSVEVGLGRKIEIESWFWFMVYVFCCAAVIFCMDVLCDVLGVIVIAVVVVAAKNEERKFEIHQQEYEQRK
jgi:hypothetical protein